MRAGARESPGRPLGWQPLGPSAVPGVVAAPPLPRRHLSRPAAPRLRHSKVGREMKRMRKRRTGRNGLEGRNKVEFGNSIQRPQVPRILKPTFEQSTSTHTYTDQYHTYIHRPQTHTLTKNTHTHTDHKHIPIWKGKAYTRPELGHDPSLRSAPKGRGVLKDRDSCPGNASLPPGGRRAPEVPTIVVVSQFI